MNWREFLDKTLATYDQWQAEGKIRHTSKVLPVGRSLEAKPWVMPTEQVERLLADSRTFALAECRCRSLGRHCDRPTDTCFFINDAADKMVAKGEARRLGLAEAREHLALANRAGLVPMSLFNPHQHLYALCQCCPCCCHDLQFMLARGRQGLIARSEYVAVQDAGACVECGECVERCHFGARRLAEGGLAYDPEQCYGCGLCVTTCPAGAVGLELRPAGA